MTVLQERLTKYIGILSDDKLITIEPLIKMMADEFAYEIEKVDFNDLTDDEKQSVVDGREAYAGGEFMTLDEI